MRFWNGIDLDNKILDEEVIDWVGVILLRRFEEASCYFFLCFDFMIRFRFY